VPGPPGTGLRVHLYAQCWNDEFMLPYFFRHYDSFVDRYVIFDDGSTDRSLAILREHPRVELRRFIRSNPLSFVLSEQALSNACWKESRDSADWVIITDIDEHLFHPAMAGYLRQCAAAGITLLPALGFQMISNDLPQDGELLCDVCRQGAPWSQMLKASIFDPRAIVDINFTTGRDRAAPIGNVRLPPRDEILLLHYKYLNLSRTHARHQELLGGLREADLANRWGHKYSWSLDELAADWDAVLAAAVDVHGFIGAAADRYPLPKWWEKFR
jgi:glycosyltransferase involved in cell wall biosynthesis